MKSNLFKRTITGTILAIIIFCCIYFLPKSLFSLCCFGLSLLAGLEFAKILKWNFSEKILNTIFLITAFSSNYFFPAFYIEVIVFAPLIYLGYLFVNQKDSNVNNATWVKLLEFLFAGVFQIFIFLTPILIFNLTNGKYFLLAIIGIVVMTDIFSYFSGSLLGKNPLWKKLSPGKSWEGFIIGVSCSSIIATLLVFLKVNLSQYDFLTSNWLILLFTVFSLCILSVFGDMLESFFKRSKNIKDSGSLLPGHGGILDRVDGLFFVLPVFWYIIRGFLTH